MAFLVEDGTGLSASNSYASIAEFKAYFLDRGSDYSALTDAVIQAALIKACDYIDNRFRFKGTLLVDTQAMQWPRNNVYDSLNIVVTGVPKKVKNAAIEYANRARTSDLWNTPTYDTAGVISGKSVTVGPITTSTQYSQAALLEKAYPQADKYLKEFLAGSGGNYR